MDSVTSETIESASEGTDICLGCGTLNSQLITAPDGERWRICSAVGCRTAYPADWPREGQLVFVRHWLDRMGLPWYRIQGYPAAA